METKKRVQALVKRRSLGGEFQALTAVSIEE